jgi:hypothetical protein
MQDLKSQHWPVQRKRTDAQVLRIAANLDFGIVLVIGGELDRPAGSD